ncbi:MAG: DUF2510 domain-containing protein [Actinomycetota bacterium]
MYTYDVVSESVRTPHELAAELSRRSQQGWEVVEIVFDGAAWFHAFIRHHGDVAVAPYPGAPTTSQTGSTSTAGTSGWGSGAGGSVAPGSSAAGGGSATGTFDPQGRVPGAVAATQAATTQAVPEVPANWYKDPSGRYELRYWNGTAWTEHVATGGKQSVDPPKP